MANQMDNELLNKLRDLYNQYGSAALADALSTLWQERRALFWNKQ
jgi:hypothetical protein